MNNIKKLEKQIPKEYKAILKQIASFYYERGVEDMKDLLLSVAQIPNDEIIHYGVYHSNDLDGG